MPKKFPPTKIYLDTSVIIKESFLKGFKAQMVLQSRPLLPVTVCLPDVVRDEVVFNFPPEINQRLKSYKDAEEDLRKLVQLPAHKDISADLEVLKFKNWLKKLAKKHKIQILPYPKLSLKTLVKDSYKRRKPFKKNGEGYKDYLIWHSILADLQKTRKGAKVYFLTNNVTDFCEKKDGVHVLHSNLAKDLREGQKPPEIFTSIKGFFDDVLSPWFEDIPLSEVPDLTRLDIEEYAKEMIEKELYEKELYELEEISLEISFNSDILISDILSVTLDKLTPPKKSGDDIVLYIHGAVELELQGDVDRDECNELGNYIDVEVMDYDRDASLVSIRTFVETPVEVTLLYSISEKKFVDYEVILPNATEYDP